MNNTLQFDGNKVTFDSELVLEGSWGETSIGIHKNQMEFVDCNNPYIVWSYGIKNPDEDETTIGLWFVNRKLEDYDGVMSLPDEAVALLESLGYNCDYAKD